MAYAPQALQILSGCLSAPLPRAQEQVLDAFTSWLKLTGGVGLTGPMLMQSPLVRWVAYWLAGVAALETSRTPPAGAAVPLPSLSAGSAWPGLRGWPAPPDRAAGAGCWRRAALEGLRSADTFFSAVDAVVELIYCTSQRGRPKDDMAPLVQLIVPEVMALKPRWGDGGCGRQAGVGLGLLGLGGVGALTMAKCSKELCPLLILIAMPHSPGRRFHVCLQQALAERNGTSGVPEGEHDDSEEDAKGMARLFAEVGEAYTGLIAEGGPQVGGALGRAALLAGGWVMGGAKARPASRHGRGGRCTPRRLAACPARVVCPFPPTPHPRTVTHQRPPPRQVSAPVEALLDVASHPDDSICSMSFNFWHRLSRALTIGLHPEPLGAPPGSGARRRGMLVPHPRGH